MSKPAKTPIPPRIKLAKAERCIGVCASCGKRFHDNVAFWQHVATPFANPICLGEDQMRGKGMTMNHNRLWYRGPGPMIEEDHLSV